MDLKPGSRWRSAVCGAEVVIVRPPKTAARLECGGMAMAAAAAERGAPRPLDPAHAGGVLLGKRYEDGESGLEALCAKPGAGSLSVDGRPMAVKDAKKLPASD